MDLIPSIDFIKLKDATKLIYKLSGRLVTGATIYIWTQKGRRSYSGKKVKLKAEWRLGRWYTTEAWIRDFLKGVNE